MQFLKRVHVFEASPVVKGAGIGTRTLSAKEEATRLYLRWIKSRLPGGLAPAPALAREAEARAAAYALRARFARTSYELGKVS